MHKAVFIAFTCHLHHMTVTVDIYQLQAADFRLTQSGIQHQGNYSTVTGSNPGLTRFHIFKNQPYFLVTIDIGIPFRGLGLFNLLGIELKFIFIFPKTPI